MNLNIVSKVYAEDPWSGLQGGLNSGISTWGGLLEKIYELINFLIPFSALIAVVMIVVGGYSLITSTGDPDKIKKGTEIITGAVVGMILVFGVKLIIGFVIDNAVPK